MSLCGALCSQKGVDEASRATASPSKDIGRTMRAVRQRVRWRLLAAEPAVALPAWSAAAPIPGAACSVIQADERGAAACWGQPRSQALRSDDTLQSRLPVRPQRR